MNIAVGQIAMSMAGHDKGEFFVITAVEGKYVYICNGKQRKLEKPKKKKIIHIQLTRTVLDIGSINTNRKLIKALAIFKKESAQINEEA